ncbi:MAG: hypothetical protein HXY50_00470 [Ignavibacteriaceae bacterium]|nr:hypothetical protein [Ignavibacteriaceae bacterium]
MSLEKSNYIFNDEDANILSQINARLYFESIDITLAAPFIQRNLHLPNPQLADLLQITRSQLENILHRNKIKRTEEQLRAIRERTGVLQRGEQNGNWRGGISTNHYSYKLNQKEKWPERIKARNKVRAAIKSGKLIKDTCFICGVTNTEAHHHKGYDQPLTVLFLCKSHHRAFDIFQRAGLTEVKEYFIFVLSVTIFLYKTNN